MDNNSEDGSFNDNQDDKVKNVSEPKNLFSDFRNLKTTKLTALAIFIWSLSTAFYHGPYKWGGRFFFDSHGDRYANGHFGLMGAAICFALLVYYFADSFRRMMLKFSGFCILTSVSVVVLPPENFSPWAWKWSVHCITNYILLAVLLILFRFLQHKHVTKFDFAEVLHKTYHNKVSFSRSAKVARTLVILVVLFVIMGIGSGIWR